MKIAVYPGSFDPVTNGHLDIIKRSAKMFDKVVVAVLQNQSKSPVFEVKERLQLLKSVTKDIANIEVDSFSGLLVDYVNQKGIHVIVKGLRAVSDFEYEFQMALMNRKLNSDIETVFLTTSSEYSYLSSSLVKEVFKFKGCIKGLVPDEVLASMIEKYRE